METWYKVRKYALRGEKQIEPVKVEKSTEKTIIINGKRINKKSEYDNYFQTYDDAHRFLKTKKYKLVIDLSIRLAEAQKDFMEFFRDYTK